jgi:hypothetical protein
MSIQSTFQIGSVLRNAVVFDFKNSPSDFMKADSLLTLVDRLFSLLEERKIDYAMVGGVALLTYVEGRNTQDLDLIMSLPSLAKIPEIEILNQDIYFAHGRFGELQIDVLLTRNPLFEEARQRYSTEKQFMERKIRCASVEGLLLLKLYALPSLYRQGNFVQVGLYENDISSLIYAYQPSLKTIFTDLEKHLGEADIQEVHKIVEEIHGRIERFRKSSGKSLPNL